MQRREQTHGLLGTAAAAVLLAMTLGLAGCSSSSSTDAEVPPDPEGSRFVEVTFTIDDYMTGTAPINNDALSLAAGHQLPVPAFAGATINQVRVIDGPLPAAPSGPQTVDVELTLAKWLPERGTWISMLQRDVSADGGARVIRAGNLRLQGDTAVAGGINGQFITMIKSPDPAQYGPGSGDAIDFSNGVAWRTAEQSEASRYCGDDPTYCAFVQEILDDINASADSWDDNAIYRVGVTSRNLGVSRFNAIGYFRGNGVPASDPNPVMTQASCSSCHSERVVLNVHGNQRHEPELCSSCHNDFTYDAANSTPEAGGWTNIGAALMVHKIHAGIDGYMVDGRNYSDVRYPDWLFGRNVGPQNCSTCHQDDIADAASLVDAKWNVVSFGACTTCHVGDTLPEAFPPPDDRPGLPGFHAGFTSATNCMTCHDGGNAQTADAYHGVTAALAELDQRNDYRLKIVSVSDAEAGQQAQVAWQVVDGDGTPYPSVSALNPQRFLVGIGWGYGDDWVNDGVDPATLTPARTTGARGDPWRVEVTGDNTVFTGNTATTTLPALPVTATTGRNGYATIYMVEDATSGLSVNGGLVKPNTAIATLTLGTTVTDPGNDRREIVSAAGCNSCHTTTFRHGTFADDDIMGCVACHNAGSLSRDGSEVQGSVDFMFMVHAIHSIGDGNRVRFDRRRNHGYTDRSQVSTILACQSCHLEGTYDFPVERNARIGVIADGEKVAFLAGTGVNSAEASVCFSCHESGVDLAADPVKAHMETFGATMDGTGSHAGLLGGVSACTGCHTPAN